MKIIKIDSKRIERKKIDYIVKCLKKGKTVVLPTDTSYGLAANALDFKAINKVYKIKRRPKGNPLSIIVKDINQARKYSIINRRTKILFDKLLPGKLTVVVEKRNNLPDSLTDGKDLVGLRIPDCDIINKIMERIDFPITATSANITGVKEPYSISEILKQYKNEECKPDLIVDAGDLPKNKPSTVVDLSSKKIKSIRSGPIKFKDVVNSLKI